MILKYLSRETEKLEEKLTEIDLAIEELDFRANIGLE